MIYQGTPYKNGEEASKAVDEKRRAAVDKAEQPNNSTSKKV
jgi:hypothetical protein